MTLFGVCLFVRNVALDLVARGLAGVIRHKADEPRSAQYEALQAAHETAREGKKGLHSRKQDDDKAAQASGRKLEGVVRVVDLSGTEKPRALIML
jgi:endonuclease YncB( thermonuclease family)